MLRAATQDRRVMVESFDKLWFTGEGNGNTLHYSCLENSMDRGAWWATVRGVTKESAMTERLTLSFTFLNSGPNSWNL